MTSTILRIAIVAAWCVACSKAPAKPGSETSPPGEIPNRHAGQYAAVNDIRMYYEIYGEGDPLLLINGAGVIVDDWFTQIPDFAKSFRVIAPDSRGQRRTQDSDKPLSYDLMASDFVALLKHLNIKNVSIVGGSDGGVIGLDLAMHHPDLVKTLVTIGASFRVDGMNEKAIADLRALTANDLPAPIVDNYKRLSPNGPDHWPAVFGKFKAMWLTEPNYSEADLQTIACPTLLMVGDRDNLIRPEHTLTLFRNISHSQLSVIPGASHRASFQKPRLVNDIILSFLKESS